MGIGVLNQNHIRRVMPKGLELLHNSLPRIAFILVGNLSVF